MANVELSNPETRSFEVFRAVFPVAAVVSPGSGELTEQRFYGTAFAIAPGLFLTAAHVITSARDAGTPVLVGSRGDGEPVGSAEIIEAEWWPNDVALLHCGVRDKVTLFDHWRYTRLQVLDDVAAFGYPHAITRHDGEQRLNVVFRAYKGHVITTRGFERLPGNPAVYEVCAPFPEGLSGGPVLWSKDGQVFLAGLVLGEGTVQYGRTKNRVGIALPVDQFINCGSKRLGKRLGELVPRIAGVTFEGTAEY